MRRFIFLACLLAVSSAYANIEPETMGVNEMAEPQPTWFLVRDGLGPGYIFDAATGDMHGLLSVPGFTPAVETNREKNEIYAAEIYYSRLTRGTRTDVVTIYDIPTLSPKAEIEVPNKIASLPFRYYISLLDDRRHLAVFNMTPAQSVTIVDVEDQKFVTEISTPGCALNFPTSDRAFLQMCGDGTLQLIRLNSDGSESERVRSDQFFDVTDDPVFDKPIPTPEGWLLISYKGKVFEVTVDDDDIEISEPWSMLTEEDMAGNWQPGGGQLIAYHEGHGLFYVLMNNEGGFAHDSSGNEVWVFNRATQRRASRLVLPHKASHLHVSQNAAALLTVAGEDMQLHVFDVRTLKLQRSIAEAGVSPGFIQSLQEGK